MFCRFFIMSALFTTFPDPPPLTVLLTSLEPCGRSMHSFFQPSLPVQADAEVAVSANQRGVGPVNSVVIFYCDEKKKHV